MDLILEARLVSGRRLSFCNLDGVGHSVVSWEREMGERYHGGMIDVISRMRIRLSSLDRLLLALCDWRLLLWTLNHNTELLRRSAICLTEAKIAVPEPPVIGVGSKLSIRLALKR